MSRSTQTAAFALVLPALLSILSAPPSIAWAQTTAFTYQGRLNDSGSPANGLYDLRFAVYDLSGSGTLLAGPDTNSPVAVSNGLFTVTLDFGGAVFNGSDRWLEIGARTNGSAANFTTLSPRQQITSTPYAIQSASAGSVAASNLVGTISTSQLPGVVLTNGAGSVNLSGTFSGNGGGLTNISASALPANVALLNASQTFTGHQSIITPDSGGILYVANPQGRFQFDGWNPAAGITLLASFIATSTNWPQLRFASDGSPNVMDIGGNITGDFVVEGNDIPRFVVRNGGGIQAAGPSGTSVRVIGPGGGGAAVALDLATFDPGSLGLTNPSARIQATDDNYSADLAFQTRLPGSANDQMLSRMYISSGSGDVGIGTTSPDRPLTVQGQSGNGEWISLKDTNGVTRWHLNNAQGGVNFVQTGVADDRLFLSTNNGNVGIGTASPQARLDVSGNVIAHGDVQLGPAGDQFAASGMEDLRIVRGTIFDNGTTWYISAGAGFSVTHPSAGAYTITFSPAFSAPPSLTATARQLIARWDANGVTTSSAQISIVNFSVTPQNDSFSFIAIGPR